MKTNKITENTTKKEGATFAKSSFKFDIKYEYLVSFNDTVYNYNFRHFNNIFGCDVSSVTSEKLDYLTYKKLVEILESNEESYTVIKNKTKEAIKNFYKEIRNEVYPLISDLITTTEEYKIMKEIQ